MSRIALQNKAAEANEYWVCPKTGMEMAVIPAGRFFYGNMMGYPLETCGFSLARHPVTNAQWADFLQASDYEPEVNHPRPETYLRHWSKQKTPCKADLYHPVTWISYIDALHFVRWAGFELPSEWWWEKAARGTEGRIFPWGDSIWYRWNQDHKLAHVDKKKTARVDAYPETRTAFGCEQMIGNVSEFCLSVEGLDEKEVQSGSGLRLPTPDPSQVSADELIALRGSCYLRKDPNRMMCKHRRRLSAGRRNSWTSFRVAFSDS